MGQVHDCIMGKVHYFYWKQAAKLEGERAIRRATEGATDWLLQTDHRNILVDVMNEIQDGDDIFEFYQFCFLGRPVCFTHRH